MAVPPSKICPPGGRVAAFGRRTFAVGLLGAPPLFGRAMDGGARIVLSQLIALTGAGALAGDSFRNGVEMAVQELNAAGGVLGRLVQVSTYNTQSSPQGARASAQRALEGQPVALLGPLASDETRAVAAMARERRVLQIAADGGDGPGDPTLLFTGASLPARMARLLRWLQASGPAARLGLLSAAGGRHAETVARMAAAARAAGIAVVADLALPAGAMAAEAELGRVARLGAEALFIAAGGAHAARIIVDARRVAPQLRLFGQAGLVAPPVLAAAGEAAVGVHALADLDAPVRLPALEAFGRRFQASYHVAPDAAAMQGYMALWMVQAALHRAARPEAPLPDGPPLAAALRAAPLLAADTPGILLDTSWDAAGAPRRVAFMAEVLAGGTLGWSVLPPG